MAAAADYRIRIDPRYPTIQIGTNLPIHLGNVEGFYISPAGDHKVVVWSRGGMGNNGLIQIEFWLQTQQKLNAFVRGLLEQLKASFTLYATSIKPEVVPINSQTFNGVVEIRFENQQEAQSFGASIAPVLFSDFIHASQGSLLTLTSEQRTSSEAHECIIRALSALDKYTYGQTSRTVNENRETPCSFNLPENEPISSPNTNYIEAFYRVTPDQVLQGVTTANLPHVLQYLSLKLVGNALSLPQLQRAKTT